MEFDTIWTDADDNVWGAKRVDGGVALYTVTSGDWIEVTTLPTDSMEDLDESAERPSS